MQKIDQQESEPLYLGCSREDVLSERRAVLDQIDEALADYSKTWNHSELNI